MSWVSSNFVRALGASQWANDAAASVGIQAGIHDTQDNDLATGIDNCLNKNGANTPTANLSMGGFAHTNVAVATATTQYATLGQVVNGVGNWCGISGGSANAITLTPTPAVSSKVDGQVFRFVAATTNTAPTTLNISGVGAASILRPEITALNPGDIIAGGVYTVVFYSGSYLLSNPTPQWNAWTPAVASALGSLTSIVTTGACIISLGKVVSFTLKVTAVMNTTPSASFTFTLPATAFSTAVAFGASAGASYPGTFASLDSVTVGRVYLPSAVPIGTFSFALSGTYQGA